MFAPKNFRVIVKLVKNTHKHIIDLNYEKVNVTRTIYQP